MKGGTRRLVFIVNALAAAGIVSALVNCGGGARPGVVEDNGVDASRPSTGEDGAAGVTILGYEPEKGLLFGDEGFTNCGDQASDKTLTLKNNTSDIVTFEAKLTVGDKFYKVSPEKAGVPFGGQALIQITPTPIPADSEVAPDLYAGTLEIKFSTGEPPTVIRLHQTARGAIVKTTVAGSSIDFGSVKVNSTGTQTFSMTNSGNAEVTAEIGLGTQVFKIDGAAASSTKIGANETVSKTVSFGPIDIQDYTDQLAISFGSAAVFCKPPPGNVTLAGKGTSSVTVTPGLVDLGQIECGTAADYRVVTIASTVGASFTPTLAGGTTKYTLADGSGNPVTNGNPVTLSATVPYELRVVPKAVPIPTSVADNALGDKLTITTTAPGDTPHVIDIKQTARGAILAVSPGGLTNNGSIDQVFNNGLSVVNTGNAPADFTLAVTDLLPSPAHPGFSFSLNKTSGSAPVGSTPVNLQMKLPSTPTTEQLASLSLGVQAGAVLCQDLPGKYPLTAKTGATTQITVNPGSLNFGQVDCKTQAAHQVLTLKSIVDVDVTPTFGKGAASAFTLEDDGTGAPIVLGTPLHLVKDVGKAIRVVPKTVPVPSSTADNGLGDTLTFTSPLPAPDDKKTIALAETAHGAVLSFTQSSMTCEIGKKCGFTLKNDGNADGAFTLTSTAGPLDPVPTTLLAKASFNGAITGSGAPGEISLSSPSVLCNELLPLLVNK